MGKAVPGTALTTDCGDVTYASNAGGSTCTLASMAAGIEPGELDGLINELARKQGCRPKVEYDLGIEGVEFVWRENGERTMDCLVLRLNEDGSIMFNVSVSSGRKEGVLAPARSGRLPSGLTEPINLGFLPRWAVPTWGGPSLFDIAD